MSRTDKSAKNSITIYRPGWNRLKICKKCCRDKILMELSNLFHDTNFLGSDLNDFTLFIGVNKS